MATSVSANRKRASQHLTIGVYIIVYRILHARLWIRILSSRVQLDRYWVEHEKIKLVSTSGHVMSSISPLTAPSEQSLTLSSSWSRRRNGGSAWIESVLWSSCNPNFCTGQSCFLSWNSVCVSEHPFIEKPIVPTVPSARKLGPRSDAVY